MRKTETLNLRVSLDFKNRLAEEARREKRSITNYIEAALSEFWRLKASGPTHERRTKKRNMKHT
jgi:hypothetical protein